MSMMDWQEYRKQLAAAISEIGRASPGVVRGYRELVQAHVATLRRELGQSDMDYFLFDTRRPLGAALFEYLSIRERLRRVR